MYPYLVTFAISVLLFFLGNEFKPIRNIFYIIALLPPVFLAGLRDVSIGFDTSAYPFDCFSYALHCNNLWQMLAYDLDIEGQYKILAYVSAQIAPIFNVHLLITHAVILVSFLYAFKKSNVNVAIAFFFIFMIFYVSSLNIARQFLAMPFCLIALAEYRNRKYVATALCMLIAIGFHHSALLYILILLLYYLSIHYKQQMNTYKIQLLVTFVIVFCIVFFVEILQLFISMGLADVKYQERYGSDDVYGASVPISMLALTVFNYSMFSFFVPERARKKTFGVFAQYILLLAFLFCFSGLISTHATRLAIYFTVTSIICMVWAIRRSNILFFISTSAFYVFYWFMAVVVANLGAAYPYKSAILGI